jgi:hypothetical protein
MRDAGPRYGVSACVSVRILHNERGTTSVPTLESGRLHAPYCTNDCQYCHATSRKLKLETTYHPQRENSRMQANLACVSKSA